MKFSAARRNPGKRSTENFTQISRQISRHFWQRKAEKIFTSSLLQGSCSEKSTKNQRKWVKKGVLCFTVKGTDNLHIKTFGAGSSPKTLLVCQWRITYPTIASLSQDSDSRGQKPGISMWPGVKERNHESKRGTVLAKQVIWVENSDMRR